MGDKVPIQLLGKEPSNRVNHNLVVRVDDISMRGRSAARITLVTFNRKPMIAKVPATLSCREFGRSLEETRELTELLAVESDCCRAS